MSAVHYTGKGFVLTDTARGTHDAARSIPGARWDGKKRVFHIPVSSAPFLPELERYGFRFMPDARTAVDNVTWLRRRDGITIPEDRLCAPLPDGRTLFAHQRAGVRFLAEGRYVILADDMGLGKTVQALVAARFIVEHLRGQYEHDDIPVLVICPASLRDNWLRESQGAGMRVSVHSWAKLPSPPVTPFLLIADEAHYAQSGTKTKRGAGFLALADEAEAVFALSGTPMKNGRPANLYPLLRAVRSPLATSKSWFESRYCDAKATRFSRWDTSGAKNLAELGERVRPVMLRRMKTECLDLPEKIRVMRQAGQTPEGREIYSRVLDEKMAKFRLAVAERVSRGEDPSAAEAMVRFGYMRQASSAAKVPAAVEIATEVLEQGGQIVVFSAFVETARAIARAFAPASALLIGETPQDERQKLVDDFQAGELKVFSTTFGAGGVGITLTRAQTVLLLDRPWTPGDCYQAEDRIHRIGQTGASVLSIWLQWDDTDAAIDALLEAKSDRIEVVMRGRKVQLRAGMTMNEFAREVVR